jgi:site-specific DNA-methyltransferase (adenine-specific)
MGDLEHEFGRQWEAIAFYAGVNHEFNYRPVDVIRAMRISPDKLVHPNEKPIGAITPLLASSKGNVVLDPFLGSGVSALAAKLVGKKYIGIEIEERYCEISAKRLSQSVMSLEIPQADKIKQESMEL